MITILLLDLEITRSRAEAFATARNDRDADQFAAFVEVGALFAKIDPDGGRSGDMVSVPIGDIVEIRARRLGRCGGG